MDGRKVISNVAVKDELDQVGAGTHTRFVVDKAKTFERLKAKAATLRGACGVNAAWPGRTCAARTTSSCSIARPRPCRATISRHCSCAACGRRSQRAYAKVPHVRKKFDAAGVQPGDLKTLADIARFPFTAKADLRDNYPVRPVRRAARRSWCALHASSGTTGKPTVVGYTRAISTCGRT